MSKSRVVMSTIIYNPDSKGWYYTVVATHVGNEYTIMVSRITHDRLLREDVHHIKTIEGDLEPYFRHVEQCHQLISGVETDYGT